MFDSTSVYDNTPLLSRQFITTSNRIRFPFCTPKIFFKTVRGCIAEFLATTILVFVSTMIINSAGGSESGSILQIAIGIGFSYGALVATTMHVRYLISRISVYVLPKLNKPFF